MSEPRDLHQPEDEASIQVDVWGIKVRTRPSAREYRAPKTLKELGKRVKRHLLTLVEAPLAIATAGVAGTINLIRGIPGLVVRPDARDHQAAADTQEDAQQEALPELEAVGAPSHASGQMSVAQALETLEDVLREIQARTGLHPEIREMEGGAVAVYLVSSESLEPAEDLSDQILAEVLEDKANRLAAILQRPISELGLSVRARKGMIRLGIPTIGELTQRTAKELLEVKNFGPKSLEEVREKLTRIDLRLQGD